MRKIILYLLLLALLAGGYFAWRLWRGIFGSATAFATPEKVLFIPKGADLGQVLDSLKADSIVADVQLFKLVAERKNYDQRVRPGRYVVPRKMAMNDLVDKLRRGEQDPVRVTIGNVGNLAKMAGQLAATIEADSAELAKAFMDPANAQRFGFDKATFIAMFLPNTYELWWTATPGELMDRFAKEYKRFWNDERKQAARALGLSQSEVATLASIVQAETGRITDAPMIASVYLNRLRIGMPLQADPTLKYALGLDSLNRILHVDKLVDSPYNTYAHKGLPPGPINLTEARFIDAVLKPAKSDYLYFCAREDLSGYSNFSTTYQQHVIHARRYQQALNRRGIMR